MDLIKKLVKQKFESVTIYPLSQMEMSLGHLWGHGKDEKDLTDEEKMNRAKWQQCRENILNYGNHHKREMIRAINQSKGQEKRNGRYKTTFVPANKLPDNFGNK